MEGKSLADQIRALNETYGRILTLSELIECKKRGEITVSKELPIDEYAYVHATNFEPNNNSIDTVPSKFKRGEQINFYNTAGRDTTHFAVNGQVEEHGDGAAWDKCKYSVVIPARSFLDRYKDRTGSLLVEDSFVDGSPDITDQFIICSIADAEELQRKNPDTIIIPAEDNGASRPKIVEDFLRELLDIQPRVPTVGGWGVINTPRNESYGRVLDREAEAKYYADVESYLGRTVNKSQHRDTLEELEESFLFCSMRYQSGNTREIETHFLSEDYRKKYQTFLRNPEEHQLSMEHLEFFTEKFNKELAEVGLSDWIYYVENKDDLTKRVEESRDVDRFLGVKVEQIYDGDMISTNLKRLEMIGDRNPELKKAIFDHICQDYKLMKAHYMERADTKDMDFKVYSENLRSRLSAYGLATDFDDQVMTTEEKQERQDEEFFKAFGFSFDDSSDPVLSDISKLEAIALIQQQMMIQAVRDGNLAEDGFPEMGEDYQKLSRIETSVLEKMKAHLQSETNPERLDEPLAFIGLKGADFFMEDPEGNMVPTINKYGAKASRLFDIQGQKAIEIVQSERNNPQASDTLEEQLEILYQEQKLVPEDIQAANSDIKHTLATERGKEDVEQDK